MLYRGRNMLYRGRNIFLILLLIVYIPVYLSGQFGSTGSSSNSPTATALQNNPTDCSEGEYATGIDASGNLTCEEAASGGGYYNPDAPPETPSALDDEFEDESHNTTLWDEYDHGSKFVISEDKAGAYMSVEGGATVVWGGIYQPIPAGNFTITAKFIYRDTVLENMPGLAVFQDATTTTGDLRSFAVVRPQSDQYEFYVQDYSSYDVLSNCCVSMLLDQTSRLLEDNVFYIRTRRTSTTYSWDYSRDGILWKQQQSGTIGFTPLHFGIVARRSAAAGNFGLTTVSFFRYKNSDVGAATVTEGSH